MTAEARKRFAQLRQMFLQERGSASRLAFTSGNTVRLCETGGEFFRALIERIDAAREQVMLETYIFCDDAAGRPVSDALIRAAQRGVRVRVITDGIGTARLPLFDTWVAAGVEHCIYNRYLFGRFGFAHASQARGDRSRGRVLRRHQHRRRLHAGQRDAAVPALGFRGRDGRPRWPTRAAFELQWHRIQFGHKPYAQYAAGLHGEAFPDMFRRWMRSHRWIKAGALRVVTEPSVAFVARDNVVNRRAIEKAYLAAIGQQRQRILLANPYFMPGRKLRRALTGAARRGVDAGADRSQGIHGARYGRAFLYHSLLRAGVRGRIRQDDPDGKVAVIDDNWATVGSSNLDALSLMLNNEANVVLVRYDAVTNQLRDAIATAFAEGREIDAARYAARPRIERLLNWLAYNTYRLVMKALTVGGYD